MFRTIALIAVVTLVGAGAAAQQQPKIDEYKMVTYQAVLVTKGPAWSPETAAVMPLVRAHREYVSGLMRSGRLHIAGSFAGESPLRGVYILSGTPDEARALAEADPGVKEGRYGIEVLQWMGPEGWFRRPADGATTAALAPEAQQALMRGHLDHMDGQAKQGRLVLAGPLVKAGTRRGLIAYRVPTMAEAVERASADPMVKAGRMKPELYEWTIPAGVLK
jgi:uncharacterized protein YciI